MGADDVGGQDVTSGGTPSPQTAKPDSRNTISTTRPDVIKPEVAGQPSVFQSGGHVVNPRLFDHVDPTLQLVSGPHARFSTPYSTQRLKSREDGRRSVQIKQLQEKERAEREKKRAEEEQK